MPEHWTTSQALAWAVNAVAGCVFIAVGARIIWRRRVQIARTNQVRTGPAAIVFGLFFVLLGSGALAFLLWVATRGG